MSGLSVTKSTDQNTERHHIIIYDGVCNFCNWSIRFIIERDPNKYFVFTPMQSDLAKKLIAEHNMPNVGMDTFLLIKKSKPYIWTDAALEITKDLNGFWYLSNIFRIIPRFIRDYSYRTFARNRYNIFGRTQSCQIPKKDYLDRFQGIDEIFQYNNTQ